MQQTMQLEDLTSGTVDGSGVFDVLIKAVKSHLKEEFSAGRIKNSDYANVYVGSLTAVLQQSVGYYTQQVLGNSQVAKTDSDILLNTEQIEVAKEQVLIAKQEVLLKTKDQELKQAEIDIAKAKAINIPKEGTLLDKQATKLDSEKGLLDQKVFTEKAQTSGSLDKVGLTWQLKNSSDPEYVGGVMGRQMTLYATQADGFQRDAEQKVAKLMLDTWNIRRSTDSATVPSTEARITDNDIGQVMDKMGEGIGVNLAS